MSFRGFGKWVLDEPVGTATTGSTTSGERAQPQFMMNGNQWLLETKSLRARFPSLRQLLTRPAILCSKSDQLARGLRARTSLLHLIFPRQHTGARRFFNSNADSTHPDSVFRYIVNTRYISILKKAIRKLGAMRFKQFLVLTIAISLLSSSCGNDADSRRIRNATAGDGYEIPRVHEYEYDSPTLRAASREWAGGYQTPGTSRLSPTENLSVGRARAANIYEEIGPLAEPRRGRSISSPPPVYERPRAGSARTARTGTRVPQTRAGASMKTGNLGSLIGGLGNLGASMSGMIATAGVGMALDALGAPPFLTSMFGFGGGDSDSSAILEALGQITAMLREVNQKLDMIDNKLEAMQVSITDLNSAIQLLAASTCDESVTQTTRDVADITDPIEAAWSAVFRDNQLKAGDMSTNTYSRTQLEYMDANQSEINRLNPLTLIPRIETLVLGGNAIASSTGTQAGLLSQVQKCTLARKRFLTNDDTANWQAMVVLMMSSQARAAELATWNEMYTAMKAKRSPNLTTLNLINLSLRHSMSTMGFHVSMQIPDGQFLDTVTNKMWRMAPSGTRNVGLQQALTKCLPDEDAYINYAPVPSWNGTNTVNLDLCPVSRGQALQTDSSGNPNGFPLDLAGGDNRTRGSNSAQQWRIPTIGEMQSTGNSRFAATTNDNTPGLLDAGTNKSGNTFTAWSASNCGLQRNQRCGTPADYLRTYGFSQASSDLGIVWTNSTAAAVGLAGTNKNALQDSWNIYNTEWKPVGDGTYGWCPNGEQMGGWKGKVLCPFENDFCRDFVLENIYRICTPKATENHVIQPIPSPSGVSTKSSLPIPGSDKFLSSFLENYNYNFPRLSFCARMIKSDEAYFNPYTAEVMVMNFGQRGTTASSTKAPVGGADNRQNVEIMEPSDYRAINPGASTSYFASRELIDAGIACRHWGTYGKAVAQLPQTAQAMWVRNLQPNEAYYSITGTNGPTGIPELRSLQQSLQPASVSILSMNGQAVIHSRAPQGFVGQYTVKCIIDPKNDPIDAQEVITWGSDCPVLSFESFADGPYRIYAATALRRNGIDIISNLEIADIAISSLFARSLNNLPSSSTSTSTSTSLAPAVTELTLRASSTDSKVAGTDLYNIPVTSASSTDSKVAGTDLYNVPATSASSGTIDIAALVKRTKLKAARNSRVSVSVAKASRLICRFESPQLIGLRTGTCKVTITVTPKKGKKKSRLLAVPVTG